MRRLICIYIRKKNETCTRTFFNGDVGSRKRIVGARRVEAKRDDPRREVESCFPNRCGIVEDERGRAQFERVREREKDS